MFSGGFPRRMASLADCHRRGGKRKHQRDFCSDRCCWRPSSHRSSAVTSPIVRYQSGKVHVRIAPSVRYAGQLLCGEPPMWTLRGRSLVTFFLGWHIFFFPFPFFFLAFAVFLAELSGSLCLCTSIRAHQPQV